MAFIFALDICNIQDPVFTGLPAMMQNLPFVKQNKRTPNGAKEHPWLRYHNVLYDTPCEQNSCAVIYGPSNTTM